MLRETPRDARDRLPTDLPAPSDSNRSGRRDRRSGCRLRGSCWLVNALALSGRVDDARSRFEALLEYLSPLGLVAEEIDAETGAHLGNFPQAFSHIGIVNSALYLGYALGNGTPGPAPMGIRLGKPIVNGTHSQ
ncbi:glycoside hydrolase 15-like protein [Natrialba chahannaoensis JCM 10990]|uniref:Glycoside hydrolase 15-like protein n=1 Tax=Natrialba chahannaoensis JCM 10990 TaxID=1227492 RepID=M0B6R1_9EURY|nr:glycoside hydrolase 15-like protein [Natrialba chahannaoensis JCM 10990]